MGPHCANTANGCTRITSAFDKEQARHQAGPPQSAAAMNQDAITGSKPVVQLGPYQRPGSFEPLVRNIHVANRQMAPFHAMSAHLLLQVLNGEKLKLVVLDQRHDNRRAPGTDGPHVFLQVAVPAAGSILFPWTESQSKAPFSGTQDNLGNLQW